MTHVRQPGLSASNLFALACQRQTTPAAAPWRNHVLAVLVNPVAMVLKLGLALLCRMLKHPVDKCSTYRCQNLLSGPLASEHIA